MSVPAAGSGLSRLELAAGVDEDHAVVGFVPLEDHHRRRDAGAVEQVLRQADDRIEQISSMNLRESCLRCELRKSTPWGTITPRARSGWARVGALDHVGHEGVIAAALGRQAAPETLVLIALGFFFAPLFQRKGRVGHHHVEAPELVAFTVHRVADGVAPANDPAG